MLSGIQSSNFYKVYGKWIPIIAFLGGFLWDAITLGRAVSKTDLWILTAYYLLSTLSLRILTGKYQGKHRHKVSYVFQFCQGALFSALSIFYFKSSGAWYNLLLLIFIMSLMLANEFLFDKIQRRGLWVAMHQIIGIMLFSFLLPHWFHSVNWIWILISCVVGFVISALVSHWGRHKNQGILAIGGLLFFSAWFFNLVPPVPLVLKESFVCTNRSEYSCEVPERSIIERMTSFFSTKSIELNSASKVVFMSSIFAPDLVEAKLEHRWYKYGSDGWSQTDIVPLFLKRGGRAEGWRFYSEKKFWQVGLYKVETALKNGPVISKDKFEIKEPNENISWKIKSLK